jgi:hypothetical protein
VTVKEQVILPLLGMVYLGRERTQDSLPAEVKSLFGASVASKQPLILVPVIGH